MRAHCTAPRPIFLVLHLWEWVNFLALQPANSPGLSSLSHHEGQHPEAGDTLFPGPLWSLFLLFLALQPHPEIPNLPSACLPDLGLFC